MEDIPIVNAIRIHNGQLNFEDLKEFIDKLPEEEKALLGKYLTKQGYGLNVFLGGNNCTGNSFTIQINSGTEGISETLKNLPMEAIVELLSAISIAIKKWATEDEANH